MSILTTENLSVSFGDFDLFTGVTVSIADHSKIGLIGPNGVGKTTLLLCMAGLYKPTAGRVHLARGRRLGYLRQEAVEALADCSNTVHEEMQAVFTDLQAMQAQLNALERQMENGDFSEELLNTYGRLQEAFEQAGGYDYEVRIQQTLEGLGLGRKHWNTPIHHLSGGQKTRALLARLLLQRPDLLMLDEPTNHLDLEAVEWLERTLREWEGAVLIVSHDRYFLDNVVDTIWEMSRAGILTYPGNYSKYLLQRQERWEYYERVFNEEKMRLQNEIDFIQRNWVRASTHARALGRLRLLSRDLATIEKYGVLALRDGKSWSEKGLNVKEPLDVVKAVRRVNSLAIQGNRPPVIRPRLPAASTSGNIILRVDQAVIGYPNHPLFTIQNLELRRGECAALIGPNGSGKTTFLKVLLGQNLPLSGEVRMGASLKISYFAQAQDDLKGDHSVLDELIHHKNMLPGEARAFLASYLFQGDDVFKPLSALSGGERARLALAILALEGSNFLLLDEPTNHLDIPAREALQEVLETYSGTILLVSHDRYLIDRLATQVWELRDQQLRVFHGPYREYILHGLAPQTSKARMPTTSRQILLSKPILKADGQKARRRLEALAMIEERIHEQEAIIQRLSREMEKAGEAQHHEKVQQLSWKVAQAQNSLEDLLREWEKLAA